MYVHTYVQTYAAGTKALCGRLTGHTQSLAASWPPVPMTGRLLCGRRLTDDGTYSTNSENTSLLVSAQCILERVVCNAHVSSRHFHLCKVRYC